MENEEELIQFNTRLHVFSSNHLLESLDLGGASVSHLGGLLGVLDDGVEDAALSIRGLSSSLLHQVSDGCDLVKLSKLGLGVGAIDIDEDSLALDEDLVDIRHHAAGISELVLILEPVVEEIVVALVVLSSAKVSRSDELALTDLGKLVSLDPLAIHGSFIIYKQKLVRAYHVIHSKSNSGTGAINSHASGLEITTAHSNKAITWPSAPNGSHCEVSIDHRGSIQRVESNRVALTAHGVFSGSLLRGSCLTSTTSLQICENDIVRKNIDRKLLITELVKTSHLVTRGSTNLQSRKKMERKIN